MRTIFGLAATLVLLVSVSGGAAAQKIDGKFRLDGSVPLIEYSSATITFEDTDQEQTVTNTRIGLLESAGIGLGYAVSETVVIGVDLLASYASENQEDAEDTSETTFGIAPMLEYVVDTGGKVRPAFGIRVGVAAISVSMGDMDTSATHFVVGAELGAKGFVTNTFSINPCVSFRYIAGSGTADGPGRSTDLSFSGFGVGLGVDLSGWM